ncbi:hypothetical protein VNO78_12971 [Psophocarpus tetragonolobus]|uniref:Uncharacterized protein n=1 Tax=Psophocarpus tetragonolobus TaxID=3891 RepID=A0AAN9SQL8_PSOTE
MKRAGWKIGRVQLCVASCLVDVTVVLYWSSIKMGLSGKKFRKRGESDSDLNDCNGMMYKELEDDYDEEKEDGTGECKCNTWKNDEMEQLEDLHNQEL